MIRSDPLPAYLQAAEADVEGVVLHAADDGGVSPGVVCRGQGSYEATLRTLGLTAAPAAPTAVDSEGARPAGEPELQAATV